MHLLKGSRIALKAVTAHKFRALLAILGIVVGVVGRFTLSRAPGWPKVISPLVLLPAFGVSALVGIFFGTYPARRAARLDPIVAPRAE